MIILKETIDTQRITFIPRELSATSIVLRNETTNIETTISTNFYLENYYLIAETVFDLKENTFYNITIYNNSDIVYKDKVFCTNQVIEDFTVNENQYIENVTTNEFKIYE